MIARSYIDMNGIRLTGLGTLPCGYPGARAGRSMRSLRSCLAGSQTALPKWRSPLCVEGLWHILFVANDCRRGVVSGVWGKRHASHEVFRC